MPGDGKARRRRSAQARSKIRRLKQNILKAKFVQILHKETELGGCLWALDENGHVWWRDVTIGDLDEPWVLLPDKRALK
jgi:hypothetical protein